MGEAWRRWKVPADLPHDDLYGWQDGRCAMCGRGCSLDSRSGRHVQLVEDHCHMTGLVRGFLCRSCNSQEGWADDTSRWSAWRNHDTPARALGYVDIHENLYGNTAVSPGSALHYYTLQERRQWWSTLATTLVKAGAEWPTDAPWTDVAATRKQAAETAQREAMAAVWAKFPAVFGGSA